ncbi:MAG: SufD family Fe-S cluster assembly protein [Clostridia bacterium]|nr:SufD family Fe-S cluster assembly protein [Clostridia bacterium]
MQSTDKLIQINQELNKRAQQAKDKKAKYGDDLDMDKFIFPEEKEGVDTLSDLPQRIKEASLLAGVDTEETNRSASYFQQDDSVLYQRVKQAYGGKVELMSIEDALQKHDWLVDYWWKNVDVGADKYTAYAHLYQKGGYFIRILPGAKVDIPIQACLLMSETDASQRVHNIIIAEEGSQAEIITGCSVSKDLPSGLHVGISEFYVKKNASLTFTMVHNWSKGFHVRPRTGAHIEEGGKFINNYILLKPVKSLQTNPKAVLKGEGATCRFNSIIYGCEDSKLDVGSVIQLEGDHTSGEAISRAAGVDSSKVVMRGNLIAKSNTSKAHLECKGMLLSNDALIHAIPELYSDGSPKADLTHEAAVGPINREAIEYLMARGLSEEEATSAIISGFMKFGISGLPPALEAMVENTVSSISKGGF